MRYDPVRLLARLVAVALLCGLLGDDGGAAGAQSGSGAVRFHGRVTLSGADVTPAERQRFGPVSRMLLQVVTARNADDVTVCGRTIVTLDQPYEVEVAAIPRCVSQTLEEPAPEYLFLVNGVQAAAHGRIIVNPNLATPETLGARYERDLEAPFGAVVPNAPVSTGGRLIRVRYWGTLTLAGQPAPDGAEVRVVAEQSGRLCGAGALQNGLYVVDVPATPRECVQRTLADGPLFLRFEVHDERVVSHGRDITRAIYTTPGALANAERHDLEGRNPPRADVFAADDCDSGAEVGTRWYKLGLFEATAQAVGAAQEPPLTCIELPGVLVFDDRFVRRRVEECFRNYDVAKSSPRGLAIRDVVESLYLLNPNRTNDPVITILEDPSLGITLGETAPQSERDDIAVREGRSASARVRVLPSITAGFFSVLAAVNQSWQAEAGVYDYCANVLHELVHALDYITGVKPPQLVCDFGNGLSLEAHEVKSIAAENAYRLSRAMPPRATYGSHRLPDILIHPTPANWMRYQAGEWAELCR